MIPIEKVQDIIAKHDKLEKDLSSGSVDPKIFAQKSKEYSNLGSIIFYANEYVKFDNEINDLENNANNNKVNISLPFVEDFDTKTIKFGIILLIVLIMTQNKQGQSTIIENLPDGLKSTELITNVSVSVVAIFIIFLFYKLLNWSRLIQNI